MSQDPVSVLQGWASIQQLSQVTLNEQGTELSKADDGVAVPADVKHTISSGGKTCDYTLGSIYLQIVNPDQALVGYRKACKAHGIKDPVKASDKATVVAFFLASLPAAAPEVAAAAVAVPVAPVEAAAAAAAADAAAPAPPEASSKSHKHDKHRQKQQDKKRSSSSSGKDKHRHDKKRSHSSSEKKAKKAPKTINTETLFSNLVTVVDKRTGKDSSKKEEEDAQLVAALSTEGFGVTPDLLQEHQEASQKIVAHEIPVGDSASILKAADGKDLSRILKLYMEVMQPSKSGSKSTAASATSMGGQKKSWRPYLVGKKPIIIVPKGMTAPITLMNAHEFFGKAAFVPRDVMMKRADFNKANIQTTFSRRVGQRLGGGTVDYEILDNPKSKLPTAKDWDRVVAVLCLGQSWQFKDWPGHYSNPVRLFGTVFGFYIGMEGAKIPAELASWAVTQGKVNRDRRGTDSVTSASFWNELDEFMAIHKPELLPQPET